MEKIKEAYYNRFRQYKLQYDIMYKWTYCEMNQRKLENLLQSLNINKVMIYGIGELGGLIYDKLKNTTVKVECFIDAYAPITQYYLENIDVIKPSEVSEREADLIIISLPHLAESITKDLKKLGIQIPMDSIENIIMGM